MQPTADSFGTSLGSRALGCKLRCVGRAALARQRHARLTWQVDIYGYTATSQAPSTALSERGCVYRWCVHLPRNPLPLPLQPSAIPFERRQTSVRTDAAGCGLRVLHAEQLVYLRRRRVCWCAILVRPLPVILRLAVVVSTVDVRARVSCRAPASAVRKPLSPAPTMC